MVILMSAVQVAAGLCMMRFHCSEETMLERVLRRAPVSGRLDDTEEKFHLRYERFVRLSGPIVSMFQKRGLLIDVS